MGTKVFDIHTHVYTPEAFDFMRGYMEEAGLEGLCALSFGCDRDGCAPEQNILPLLFKVLDKRFFAFGSLIYPQAPCTAMPGRFAPDFQAERLLKMGFDGIKILESKPDQRKKVGLPLDSEIYEPFFAYLEKNSVPVLWHVADPAVFWDAEKAPAFAVEAGWIYDSSFPARESIYDEVFRVLDRHPGLKVIFAHFFFSSSSPEGARRIMDKYPNLSFDVTPGIEMYEDFSADPSGWHDFFTEYAGRIYFGTDADEFCSDIMCDDEKSPALTVEHILRFLKTTDCFGFWGRQVRGIGLDERTAEKICRENAAKILSVRKDVDLEMLKEYWNEFGGHIPSEATQDWIRAQLEAVR